MGNRFHTIIFDLDGTLSDSAVLTMAALKNILPNHELPLPSEQAIRTAMGHATPEFYYILFPELNREKSNDIGVQIEQEELRLLPLLCGNLLFDGCRELIKHLGERGLRLCIASTGEREHVFSILNATGITSFFDTIFCEQPDKTEMLREMTKDGDKNGYVIVGDMKKDHEGAAANGILSIGACYGYCIRELTNFDLYIDTPLELLKILDS